MQELTIRFDSEQDLQFLLMILDKMHFVYEPPVLNGKTSPKKAAKSTSKKQDAAAAPAKNIADKYIGKMPDETAKAMLAHIEQSRNEWERAI